MLNARAACRVNILALLVLHPTRVRIARQIRMPQQQASNGMTAIATPGSKAPTVMRAPNAMLENTSPSAAIFCVRIAL